MPKKSKRRALKDIQKSLQIVNKVIAEEYLDIGFTVSYRIEKSSVSGNLFAVITLAIRHDLKHQMYQPFIIEDEVRGMANSLIEQLKEVEIIEEFNARKAREEEISTTLPLPILQ